MYILQTLLISIVALHALLFLVILFGLAVGGIDPSDASLVSQYARYLVSFIILL